MSQLKTEMACTSLIDDVASVNSEDSLTAVFDDVPSRLGQSFDEALEHYESKYGSETTWNEDVKSEIESLGLSLHDSLVMALHDEATKMDAVMAADRVSFLEEEVRRLSREVSDRKSTQERLQALLQEKEDRIGTLELERDLYKADTGKLTKDLHRCMQKLKSAEASSCRERETTPRTRSTATVSDSNPSPEQYQNLSNASWVSTNSNNSSITSATVSRSEDTDDRTSFPVIEKPRLILRSHKQTRQQPSRPRNRTFHFCRGFSSSRRKATPLVESADEDDEEILHPDTVLQEQLQEMARRMAVALDTSDELRRRLAMVSQYYESALGEMEEDMIRQISSSENEKKIIVETLQVQMHEQELLIQDLRRRGMRPFK